MKKFLITFLVFGMLFFVYDKLFIIVRNIAPDFDYDNRLERILEGDMNYDLLVFGSSRANSNIATWMIEDSLKINSFNLTSGGSNLDYQYFLLNKLLKYNQKPKIIIKVIDDDFELFKTGVEGNGRSFRLDRLYSLIKYKDIRQELEQRTDKSPLLSKFFVLNQLYRSNFDFRSPEIANDTVLRYGGKPSVGYDHSIEWDYKNASSYNKSLEDRLFVNQLLDFQELCFKHKITLIFATATGYKALNKEWVSRMQTLKSDTIPFFIPDYADDRLKQVGYYGDLSHMNVEGAKIYTEQLLAFIKKTKIVDE